MNWTHYEHRKSLVRVLLKATDLGILKVVDGDIEGLASMKARKFSMRYRWSPAIYAFLSQGYLQIPRPEEILKAEWDRGYDEALQHRHRVYRQLFSPSHPQ